MVGVGGEVGGGGGREGGSGGSLFSFHVEPSFLRDGGSVGLISEDRWMGGRGGGTGRL